MGLSTQVLVLPFHMLGPLLAPLFPSSARGWEDGPGYNPGDLPESPSNSPSLLLPQEHLLNVLWDWHRSLIYPPIHDDYWLRLI